MTKRVRATSGRRLSPGGVYAGPATVTPRQGFRPGRWGEPSGRSLTGTTVAIIGLGAVGTQAAHRRGAVLRLGCLDAATQVLP